MVWPIAEQPENKHHLGQIFLPLHRKWNGSCQYQEFLKIICAARRDLYNISWQIVRQRVTFSRFFFSPFPNVCALYLFILLNRFVVVTYLIVFLRRNVRKLMKRTFSQCNVTNEVINTERIKWFSKLFNENVNINFVVQTKYIQRERVIRIFLCTVYQVYYINKFNYMFKIDAALVNQLLIFIIKNIISIKGKEKKELYGERFEGFSPVV